MSGLKQRILDSHVHLWPEETANESGHTWMRPGFPIAKAQLPADYIYSSQTKSNHDSDVEVQGLIFIETDVRYDMPNGDLADWAKGPLDEIAFIRSIVEGEYGDIASHLVVGIVPWAPMDQSPSTLDEYLRIAAQRAGSTTWKRVKGFRFLLQSIVDKDRFQALVLSNDFISNLRLLGERGFSFDIGVDQRSGGIWQLELFAQAIELARTDVDERDKVTLIINHLCKPNFSETGGEFERWCHVISSMSLFSKTYMKLSGAFSELQPDLLSSRASDTAVRLRPWIAHVFRCFGPERVMFGSDWPVCNLNGPLGEDSWIAWKDVVDSALRDGKCHLSDGDRDRVWFGTAEEAYQL